MKKIFLHIKKFWIVIVAGVVLFACILFFKKKNPTVLKDLNLQKKSYEKEIDAINTTRQNERIEYDAAQKRFDEKTELIEKNHAEKKMSIEEEKKEEIVNTVKKYDNDIEGLTKDFSDFAGIKYRPPE